MPLYCPDCGESSLRLIEETEHEDGDEYKEVCTCDQCGNLVYIVRGNQ
jgi:transcriptional regulator NrdR family protein